MERETVIAALNLIKRECEKYHFEDGMGCDEKCLFSVNGSCMIYYRFPFEWNINNEMLWKAFLD